MNTLPKELIIEAIIDNDYNGILAFCQTSAQNFDFCKESNLWMLKVEKELTTMTKENLISQAVSLGQLEYLVAMRDMGLLDDTAHKVADRFISSLRCEDYLFVMGRLNPKTSPDVTTYNKIFKFMVSEAVNVGQSLFLLRDICSVNLKTFFSCGDITWDFLLSELKKVKEPPVLTYGRAGRKVDKVSRVEKFPTSSFSANVSILQGSLEKFGKRFFFRRNDSDPNRQHAGGTLKIDFHINFESWVAGLHASALSSYEFTELFYPRLHVFEKHISPRNYRKYVNSYFQYIIHRGDAESLRKFLKNDEHVKLLQISTFKIVDSFDVISMLIEDGRIDLSANNNILLRRASRRKSKLLEELLLTDTRVVRKREGDSDDSKSVTPIREFSYILGEKLGYDDDFYDDLVKFIAEPHRRDEALSNMLQDDRKLIIEWTTADGLSHKMFFNDRAKKYFASIVDGTLIPVSNGPIGGGGMAEYSYELTTADLTELEVYDYNPQMW